MKKPLSIFFLFLALFSFSGCATTGEADDMSERPWNAPKNWEHGLPAGMMNDRY